MSLQPVPGTTQDWVKVCALVAWRPLGVWYSSMYSPSPFPHIPQVCPLIQPGILICGRQQRVLALLPRQGFLSLMQKLPWDRLHYLQSIQVKEDLIQAVSGSKQSDALILLCDANGSWNLKSLGWYHIFPFERKVHPSFVKMMSQIIIIIIVINLWDADMVDYWQGFLFHSPSLQCHVLFDEC